MSDRVIVLYKVSNCSADSSGSCLYNAFSMPRSVGVTLATVKFHCRAIPSDTYHWRVRVDDRSSTSSAGFTWWDIQDPDAKLPLKEVTYTELNHILSSSSHYSHHSSDNITDVAKGAMRTFSNIGKAMNKVAASVADSTGTSTNSAVSSEFDLAPRIPIIIFKLVDTVKIQSDWAIKQGAVGVNKNTASIPPPRSTATNAAPVSTQNKPPARSNSNPSMQSVHAASATSRQGSTITSVHGNRVAPTPVSNASSQPIFLQETAPTSLASVNLMDFGPPNHSQGSSSNVPLNLYPPSNISPTIKETPAQRLKREYEEKAKKDNRVWDEVDQRWVTVHPNTSNAASTSTSSTALLRKSFSSLDADITSSSTTKVAAISLEDTSNAIGKSAHVAAAVHARVSELKVTQQKAVEEVRAREQAKKEMENEEDAVRARLEPIIKTWSEEHGKKKQLRALLASLHTVLWPESGWKPVGLGDLLDDKKCKLYFHKASRVVHPDKTMELSIENRFLAKRIFDALSQAKNEYDDGKK